MTSVLWNLALAVTWVVLTGRTTMIDLFVGFALASGVTYFLQKGRGVPRPFLKLYRSVDLLLFLVWELVLSNLRIAYDVLTPTHHMRPAIVGIPLDARTDAEITFLANLITLTPGTLSLGVSHNRSILYIHAMYVTDRERLIAEVKDGFERRVLELLR
jgi:multicomponent Na+:H+ antiporter subunit E